MQTDLERAAEVSDSEIDIRRARITPESPNGAAAISVDDCEPNNLLLHEPG
jgi:hypothetical protein